MTPVGLSLTFLLILSASSICLFCFFIFDKGDLSALKTRVLCTAMVDMFFFLVQTFLRGLSSRLSLRESALYPLISEAKQVLVKVS